jgi:hypothetical protein
MSSFSSQGYPPRIAPRYPPPEDVRVHRDALQQFGLVNRWRGAVIVRSLPHGRRLRASSNPSEMVRPDIFQERGCVRWNDDR